MKETIDKSLVERLKAVDNKKPDKFNWRETPSYAIHGDTEVKGFFGPYSWLSNFHESPVYFEGLLYPSSECAYQASKFNDEKRYLFQNISPNESKRLAKQGVNGENQELHYSLLYNEEQWDDAKYDIMASIVFDKFYRDAELRKMLLDTGDKYLEETNHWKDADWGVYCKTGMGKNYLGKILMKVREYWK